MTNQVNEFLSDDMTAQELAFKMKQGSTLWSTLMWLSGGLLELNNPGLSLTINSTNTNTTVTIKHKTIYDPHNIFDHYNAPAGTNKTQYLALLQKAKKHAGK
eukprot:6389974-Ditylum_brightwellii.AAC.1